MPKQNEHLARLLREDLARGKVDRKALAAACGVTKQAISNWLKDGTIEKANLAIVARFTGRPVDYYMQRENSPSEPPPFVGVREPLLPYQQKPPDDPDAEKRRRLATELFAFAQALPVDDLEEMVGEARKRGQQNARALEQLRLHQHRKTA